MDIGFLKNAKKGELLTVTVAVCALVIAAYGYFLLRPMLIGLGRAIPETKRLSFDLEQAKGDIARIPAVEARLKDLEGKIALYGDKLPTEEEFPALLESLSARAQASRVKIVKISPVTKGAGQAANPGRGQGIYEEQEIEIAASAGYHSLGEFIADLEGGRRFMEITGLRVMASPKTVKRHDVQLSVKTFILTEGGK